jgi:hypothetical protein
VVCISKDYFEGEDVTYICDRMAWHSAQYCDDGQNRNWQWAVHCWESGSYIKNDNSHEGRLTRRSEHVNGETATILTTSGRAVQGINCRELVANILLRSGCYGAQIPELTKPSIDTVLLHTIQSCRASTGTGTYTLPLMVRYH